MRSPAVPADGAGGYGFGGSDDDDRLAAILAAWRADIEADPMPELVTLDEAAEAVAAGHESRDRLRSRGRRRMPFAIAAVAAAVACAGLTVAVHGAMPGDTLWGVSKVFFSERAQGVERVEEVRNRIEAANGALARGDTATAPQRAGPGQHRHPAGRARAAGPAGPGARPGAELDRVRPVALVPRARWLRAEHGAVVGRELHRGRHGDAEPGGAGSGHARGRLPVARRPGGPGRPGDTRGADDPPPSTTTNGLSSSPGATSTTG